MCVVETIRYTYLVPIDMMYYHYQDARAAVPRASVLVRVCSMMSSTDDNSERMLPTRNLKRLNKSDPRVRVDDEFLAKYMALREMRGEHSRITAFALLATVTKQFMSMSLKQKLWILAKCRRPSLCMWR